MGTWQHWNVTKDAAYFPQIRTFGISDGRPCALMTMNGHVPVGQVDNEDEIEARYAADDVNFVRVAAGDALVTEQAHIIRPENTVIPFSAQDFTARLDWTVITNGKRNVTESITARVNWLLSVTPLHGIGNGGVETMAGLIGPDDYTGMTKRQALDRVRAMVNGLYYVDLDKETVFYLQDSPPANSAPFDLGYPRNPPTVYDYDSFNLRTDALPRADEINVRGTEGLAVWRPDGAPSGGRQAVLNVPSATTVDQLNMLGDAWLARYETAIRSGSLRTFQPGLQSGQTVHIENSEHGIDEDWIITQVNVTPLIGNEVGGDAHGLASFQVSFAKTVTCQGNIGDVLNDLQRDPVKPDCSICPGTVTLLPSGMDENLSLARGRAGMHVYDTTTLAAYDCNGQLVRSKTPATSALGRIYHEPGIYTGLLAGDRVFHLDPDLGPYGTTRWSLDDAIAAADVMDIRRFWAVGGAVFDDFNRTEAGPDIGDTSGSGLTWDRFQNTISGSAPSTEVDGTRLHYLRTAAGLAVSDTAFKLMEDDQFWRQAGPEYIFDVTVLFEIGSHPQGNNSFQLFVGDISGGANGGEYDDNGAYVRLRVGTSAANPGEAEPWVLNVGNTIAADVDETLTFDPRTAGPVYLRFMHDGTDWKAKLWPVGDAEPDWGDPDTVERPHDADDDSITGNLFALYFHHKAFVSGENFEVWVDSITPTTGDGLQSRSMVDGSLIASVSLPQVVTDVRRSPNGQHIFLLLDEEIRRYSRTLVLEDTIALTGDLADWWTDLQEWNVDDAYNLYRLADNVLERFDSAGAIEWTRDLNALYGYRFPSRANYSPAVGSGQQVVTFDNKLRVVGYDGGADWTAGSQALLLSLHPASGTLISERRFGGGATDDAQAIALQPLNNCLWLAGAAQGAEFYGTALSGLTGWLLPVDTGDAGGVVTVAVGEDV